MSPQQQLQQQVAPYRQGALSPRAGAQQGQQPGGTRGGIARVADGLATAGGKTAQGRLDFVMQVWCGSVPSSRNCPHSVQLSLPQICSWAQPAAVERRRFLSARPLLVLPLPAAAGVVS